SRKRARRAHARYRSDDRELIAADSRQGARVVDDAGQASGHRLQQLVASAMSERIVDVLEPVEIDEEQGHDIGGAARVCELMIETIAEELAIRQPRERVIVGLTEQGAFAIFVTERNGDALREARHVSP